jgi:plastocyanin
LLRISSVLALVLAVACAGGGQTLTVRVDYDHDEFATQFIRYFPNRIAVHPGDTVLFQQDWTGEAHTVTFGSAVDDLLSITVPIFEQYGHLPFEEVPPEALEQYLAAECSLPVLYAECGPPPEEGEEPQEPAELAIDQTIAQPCLVEAGAIPSDGSPCPNQELGEFDGTEVYFNSGFIPFEGENENQFELKLSDSISPGEYNFFCSVHGSIHSGTLEVVPADEEVPTPQALNEATQAELNEAVAPFRSDFADAQSGAFVFQGESFSGPYSGLVDEDVDGLLNEFIPRDLEVQVNEPVTWVMFGPHSISFDVPEYFPIYETLEDGTIRIDENIFLPAGGAPEVEATESSDPIVIDGGTYEGSGFWSSGVLYSDAYVRYTLRFSNPGTYRVACLIHPPMVGTVTVNG